MSNTMDATTPVLIATVFHRPSSPSSPPPTTETLTSIITHLASLLPSPLAHGSTITTLLRTTPSTIHRLTLHPTSPIPLTLLPTLNNAATLHTPHPTLHITIHPPLPTPQLALFDMDSTLIGQEVIDLLAGVAGPAALTAVADITARAMNGELDFSGSLRARAALLAGLPSPGVFEMLWRDGRVTLTPGAAELLRALRRLGVRTALLSGGFVPLAGWVAERLGMDHAHANRLVVGPDGRLTGEVDEEGGPVVDAARKEAFLRRYVDEYGVADVRGSVLAVGDGANDLMMLWAAGLGVAVNAKPRVQMMAPCRLNGDSLVEVLYLMGHDEAEVQRLTEP